MIERTLLASKKRNQLDRRLRFLLRRLIKILRPPFDLHAPVHVVGCELGPEDIEDTLATRTHRWRARNPCFCFIFRRFGWVGKRRWRVQRHDVPSARARRARVSTRA